MRFIDDVDLVAIIAGRGVHRALAQIARIVDSAIRCGVDLDYVEARASAPDPHAGGTLTARLAVSAAVLAIERHCEHAREGCLARAARTAQEIAVRYAAAGDCAAEGVRYVGLHRNTGERSGAVLTGECERHLGGKIPQA